jgi:NTE family protein
MSAERLKPNLRDLPIFEGIEDAALDALESELEWFNLPGGWTLFKQGDEANALYIVTYGRLAAYMRNEAGEERMVAQIHAGEVIGEVALVSGEPRTATLKALRDSELLRLTRDAFEELVDTHPKVMPFIARQLVKRLRRAETRGAPDDSPRTFMVAPLDPATPYRDVAHGLVEALGELGEKAHLLDNTAADQSMDWLLRVEAENDRVLYFADPSYTNWTQRCQRQADRILLITDGEALPSKHLTINMPWISATNQPKELVLVQSPDAVRPKGAEPWLDRIGFDHHTHIRKGNREDLARLARLLTGRAVGVVFSGGGARGISHVGVVRALREAGIPIDLTGGTSIGAIAAAGVALEWDDLELTELVRRTFTDSNPFNDYTVPVISLVRGLKTTGMIRSEFTDTTIENMWRTYYCVSTNLTTGAPNVHRRGLLWRALRASISIPGLLPPIVENGQILVDGGMINNLPGDVMSAMRRGPVIGVDIGRSIVLSCPIEDIDERPLWWLLRHGRADVPGIGSILMRSVTVSNDAQLQARQADLDFLLQPKLGNFDLLDWKGYEKAIRIGYDSTIEALKAIEPSLLQSLTGKRAIGS